MKIPRDAWHRPLLIPMSEWYIKNDDCWLWQSNCLDTYLSQFYPECYNFIKKSLIYKTEIKNDKEKKWKIRRWIWKKKSLLNPSWYEAYFPKREYDILARAYNWETYSVIGELYGISRQRVEQVITKEYKKLLRISTLGSNNTNLAK